ncbi:hypothetical protein QWY93_07470 [Echinicola jeungdonensis]|uniref:Uncharacterized protein n=1 Tax=Echinicola jeungdonensis TaxID=709343 RepID=A0ABV5J773_9BACT|nr:hypothetical protein [Echinicola jeungdonensis]MDN3669162.1 hypothetical protein [Echinicola jeungdonensis]
MKKKKIKNDKKQETEDWDFSEGFGGLPNDADLMKNVGCASRRKKKKDG